MSKRVARETRIGGELEDYPTPAWCVHRLLEAWTPYAGLWVEPCAGSGGILQAVADVLDGDHTWCAYELDRRHYAELSEYVSKFQQHSMAYHTDYLINGDQHYGDVAAVITNPPYTLAQYFVEAARCRYPNAEVVMLLRMGFLESESRVEFFDRIGAPDVYVLPNRPSFVGKGNDMSSYGWFLWPPGPPRKTGRLQILKPTPLHERKRG